MVRRRAPSSARPGWRALVEADGTLHGWLGGSCIEPTVRREALEVLRDGRARYLIFAPEDAEPPDRPAGGLQGPASDVLVFPMVCHSGGTVEIFVEPQVPAPALALYGDSPVSRALAAMAPAAGYAVHAVGMGEAAPAYRGVETVERLELPDREAYAVVATMGEWDEEAVRRALEAGARYVGLVASPRRAKAIRRALADAGLGRELLGRLVSPAGLDLGAEEPGEIAVTILAELVERRRRGGRPRGDGERGDRERDADPPTPGLATDPVCGMAVEVEEARHVHVHQGETYYFCCPHCRERFAREPARYLV